MNIIWLTGLVVVILLSAAGPELHAQPQARSLLDYLDAWKTIASEGVEIRAGAEKTPLNRPVLRIDFDFTKGAGYGGVFLDLPIELPENYAFSLSVRGHGPANNLELKLVDPDGLNVWWINRRAFEWPAEPTRLSNRKRHFQFAWGPSRGKPLARLGRVELIIAANEGGRGTIWIDEFRFTPLPPEKPYTGTPVFSASSNANPQRDLFPWMAAENDPEPWLAVDFGEPREIGGLVVFRPEEGAVGDFDVEVSDGGRDWSVIRRVRGASHLPSELSLPDLQTRWLRLRFKPVDSVVPRVSELKFLDTVSGASPNAFWRTRAARAARGLYPRTLLNEQSFWTVIGQPGDDREALINEEGQIEVDRRGFSIEPFIMVDKKLLTWADGTHEQSLRDGWIPIPSVIRRHQDIGLTITALAAGEPGASRLHVSYGIRNISESPQRGRLVLAVRPIQVLPPWQDLNITGGWTAIESIRRDGDSLLVNEKKDAKRIAAVAPTVAGASHFDAGDPLELLNLGIWSTKETVECSQRSATGMLGFEYELAAGATETFLICVPFHGVDAPADRPRDAAEFEALAARVAADWSARVERVKFQIPDSARQFHDTIRATQAYILINHDGDGFQPGSRTYNRSWMRDGSMTSAAMLEFGHDQLVHRFIDWYAPYQFPSGKVPCVVDRRGADPVNEHDAHGQLIWLIANYYRFTGDADLVRRHFARVKLAVEYIESLRAQRMTDEFGPDAPPRQEPGEPPVPAVAFRGLVPESISHEGYSAKPMHSFWDTFFILRGLNDAAFLARVVGEADLAQQWQKLADDFRASLIASILLAQKAHGIDYLPGCVELGDFDSTSSTILLWPVEEANQFPREWIDSTFERAWREFVRRRDQSPPTWEAYTPYELRHVNTYVRLGQKERAWEALDWYLGDQRPPGWRHWAEVVHREPATPRMIGDMPHTWCGSDFLNAARAMFVYEDRDKQRLILLAGIPDDWFTDPAGFSFSGLPTEFGKISATVKRDGANRLIIRFEGDAQPPGGFELSPPSIRSIRINGREFETDETRIHFDALPAVIDLNF